MLFVNLSEISCANYLLLLFTMKFFGIFSESIFHKKIFFFCVLAKENQETFSEKCSLISGLLQGLVKICKKYMEVNLFLLLSCSTLLLT